jgi:Protein of unknown function (DUF3618)
MGEDPGTGREGLAAASEPEQIEREIEQTRTELGDTVEALARKTDVKAQARAKLEQTKETVAEKTETLLGSARADSASSAAQTARENPLPLAAGGAFLIGFLAGRVTKR